MSSEQSAVDQAAVKISTTPLHGRLLTMDQCVTAAQALADEGMLQEPYEDRHLQRGLERMTSLSEAYRKQLEELTKKCEALRDWDALVAERDASMRLANARSGWLGALGISCTCGGEDDALHCIPGKVQRVADRLDACGEAERRIDMLRERVGIEARDREQWEANAESAMAERDEAQATLDRVREALHRLALDHRYTGLLAILDGEDQS